MREAVWSSGEKPVKSLKSDRKAEVPALANPAALVALGLEPRTRESPCTRDDVNAKLGDRHLVGRAVSNPFFINNTYLDDIAVETSYLRPRNTKD
jgi:hypothetical protein